MRDTPAIAIPSQWTPRSHNRALLEAFDLGCKRLVAVRHRRSGKSTDAVVVTLRSAWQRVGNYYIIVPTYSQGRRIYWDSLIHDGRRLLVGYVPAALLASVNEARMQVRLVNGSTVQIIGADEPQSLVGANPVGVVFDEYAVMESAEAWDLVRPMLAENNGWALFCFTTRGRNHAWQLYEMARRNPEWFVQLLTVNDTKRDAVGEDGSPVVDEAIIDAQRLEGMPESLVAQEFYCSFQQAVAGAVYGAEMARVDAEGRIRHVPYDPRQRVITAWDIGRGTTAIVFTQQHYESVRIIDYVELQQDDLVAAVKALRERPYVYVPRHLAPHDMASEEWGAGRSRLATARKLGIHFRVLPRTSVDEGIHAARLLLSRCLFDETKTSALVGALSHYEREFDEDRKVFAVKPRADWSSHGADAFRYLALGVRDEVDEEERTRPRVNSVFSVLDYERPPGSPGYSPRPPQRRGGGGRDDLRTGRWRPGEF